jgi:hypothetical protein
LVVRTLGRSKLEWKDGLGQDEFEKVQLRKSLLKRSIPEKN